MKGLQREGFVRVSDLRHAVFVVVIIIAWQEVLHLE